MRIAFVTKNWLGDILMQTPAIHALRKNFPDAEVIGFVPERCREVLLNNPDIDRLVSFHEREDMRGIFSKLRFIAETRRERIDRAYLFHRSFTRALLFTLAGAKRRIGYATKGRGWLLTDPICEFPAPVHQVDYFLRLLKESGLDISSHLVSTRFYPNSDDSAHARELLRTNGILGNDYIIIHAGANWEPKRWDPRKYAEMADYLYSRYHVDIILTGGEADVPLAKSIAFSVKRAQITDLTGKTRFGVLGALFQTAQLVVSGDSGPMHLAASVGAPLLALFLATDSGLTGPRGTSPTVIVQKKGAVRQKGLCQSLPASVYEVDELNVNEVLRIIESAGLLEMAHAGHQDRKAKSIPS
ncbi:MAG: glycosyltransferase family 9 protein [Candidatus Omnitrophica bacterium]|nr:glycosyltransferase family 9 protein [Candidatus Omnitrophota bacterium]